MHFSAALTTTFLFATSTFAIPQAIRTSPPKSMMANVPEWTLESMKRVCGPQDLECRWSFHINTHLPETQPTHCEYMVKGAPASTTNGAPSVCGGFNITSGFSDEFGAEKGFTVLSVTDFQKRLVVWAGYTDQQLADGHIVQPDQSYLPTSLP